MINYLKLDNSLELEKVHKVPESMNALSGVISDQNTNALLTICGLNIDLQTHIGNLSMPEIDESGLAMKKD